MIETLDMARITNDALAVVLTIAVGAWACSLPFVIERQRRKAEEE